MISKTIIGVEVQGAEKAAKELNSVAAANKNVEKTAKESSSLDKLNAKFDSLSDSVGKGMSKLNDLGDMFKIVGVIAGGGALFGGLQDIVEVLGGLSDKLGITRAATLAWSQITGELSEDMTKAAIGVEDLTEHFDLYKKQIGLTSEAELTWSERQDAMADAAQGRIKTIKQVAAAMEELQDKSKFLTRISDIQEMFGIDVSAQRAIAGAAQNVVELARDRETNRIIKERVEQQKKFAEDWLQELTGRGSYEQEEGLIEGIKNLPSKKTLEIDVILKFLGKGGDSLSPGLTSSSMEESRRSMRDSIIGGIQEELESITSIDSILDELDGAVPDTKLSVLDRVRDVYLDINSGMEYLRQAFSRGPEPLEPGLEISRGREIYRRSLRETFGQALASGDDLEYFKQGLVDRGFEHIQAIQNIGAVAPAEAYGLKMQVADLVQSGDLEGYIDLITQMIEVQNQLKVSMEVSWQSAKFSMVTALRGMMSEATNFGGVLSSIVGVFTNAIGSMITNLIISGSAGAKSIWKTVGNALAGISAQAFGYSVLLAGLGTAAALTGVLGLAAPPIFAASGVMAATGTALGVTARLMGADKLGQIPKGAGNSAAGGGGGSSSLSNPYQPQGGETHVTVIIGGEVVTRGVKTETRRQNLRGGITEGRMALAGA